MSRIRSTNTRPEIATRSLLHGLGYRFRLHRKDLPGKPDIVLPKHELVIFVHGCYWHRHPDCKMTTSPKTRIEFWKKKFRDNIARDKRNRRALEKMGWNVAVIWECETKSEAILRERIESFFRDGKAS